MEKMYFETNFDLFVNGVKFNAELSNIVEKEDTMFCKDTFYTHVTQAGNTAYVFFIKDHEIKWEELKDYDECVLKLKSIIEKNILDNMKEDLFYSPDDVIEKELEILKTQMQNLLKSIEIKKPKYAIQDVRKFFNANASFMTNEEIFRLIDDLNLSELNADRVKFWQNEIK